MSVASILLVAVAGNVLLGFPLSYQIGLILFTMLSLLKLDGVLESTLWVIWGAPRAWCLPFGCRRRISRLFLRKLSHLSEDMATNIDSLVLWLGVHTGFSGFAKTLIPSGVNPYISLTSARAACR